MKLFVALMFFVTITSIAIAEPIKIVSIENDGMTVSYLRDAPSNSSQTIKRWFEYNFKPKYSKTNQPYFKGKLRKVVQIHEVDCENEKIRYMNAVGYDSKGKELFKDIEGSEWESVVPETVNENIFVFSCTLDMSDMNKIKFRSRHLKIKDNADEDAKGINNQ